VAFSIRLTIGADILELAVGGGYHVGAAAVGDVEALDAFGEGVSGDFSFANVEEFDGAVHAGADELCAVDHDLADGVLEAFDDFDGVVAVVAVVPAADRGVVGGTDLSGRGSTMTLLSGLKQTELTRAV
jgi:hypothetical protein